jgi:hypothetical protein
MKYSVHRSVLKPLFSLIGVCFLVSACMTKRPVPTTDELNSANYGTKPIPEEVPEMVRSYLKRRGYFDPNGAEIEDCSEPEKAWKYDPDNFEGWSYLFGWQVRCDINAKNRMGGFIGFEAYDYLVKDGEILIGRIPFSGGGGLFTPSSNPILWRSQ